MEQFPRDTEADSKCPHGNNAIDCEKCKLEESPARRTAILIREKSDFHRSDGASPNCTIEREGRKFKIDVIESGKDAALSDVQKLFEDTFGEEEVDTEDLLRTSVDGVTPWGTEDSRYRIITVRDEEGKLVATISGATLDMLDEAGAPTGEATYFVGYAVTNPNARQGGIAREAYVSALMDAAIEAESRGVRLKFAIGECTYTSEKFWNNIRWKRVYSQTGDKKEYTELKYVQPALAFDEDTGEIAEDAGEVPEHLMIDGLGPETPSKEDIERAYLAIMHFNTDWPEEAFSNKDAHTKHHKYLGEIKSNFKKFIDKNGQLIFLDIKDREKAKEAGVTIHEYSDADHGETGEEDF